MCPTPGEFRDRLDKAGRILIISNLNRDCKEIFEMYKGRDVVEKHFDVAKNMLKADILYLRDDYFYPSMDTAR